MSTDRMYLQPQVVMMDNLLDQVASGQVRVPRFQRPFVWTPDRMLQLFDSIERSYPIGSLLLWETTREVPVLGQVGDIPVSADDSGGAISYVLDGHQRLSTLFGVLRRPRRESDQEHPHWRWQIYRVLDQDVGERYRLHPRSPYRHHRSSGLLPAHHLPLSVVSRTMDFLTFSRGLELQERSRERLEELIRRAEEVAQRIKSYQVPVIKLVGGTLNEAVEVYTRMNRQGVRMEPDQMVSALTYRVPNQPTLADQIDNISATIAETGFGVAPRPTIFRALLAVAGESDVMSPTWEAVADRLGKRLYQAVPDAEQALSAAVDFLRSDVRLRLAALLPYAHQLTMLAAFFHHCPKPSEEQRRTLEQWFWTTSWTGRFASASYALMRRELEAMAGFAAGTASLSLDSVELRPVPDEFNLNSARTKAYLTWELREFPDRLDAAGHPVPLERLIASGASEVFRPVVVGNRHPANRVVLPAPAGMSVRKALTEIWAPDRQAVLASHGIPRSAWDRLCEGNGEGFVRARAAYLTQRLQQFTQRLGLVVSDDFEGGSDDDTE